MEDVTYVLTPKGCALAAMLDVKLIDNIDDSRVNAFWILFENYMARGGYIKEADGNA